MARNRRNKTGMVEGAHAPEIEEISPLDKMPWETSYEHQMLLWFYQSTKRSIRQAYQMYCKANGIKPKKQPPSSWYISFREGTKAERLVKQQIAAIERAGQEHARFPDWDQIEAMARKRGELDKLPGAAGRKANALVLIQHAFDSLAIDLEGNPLPGLPTWEMRAALAYALEQGDEAGIALVKEIIAQNVPNFRSEV